MDNQYYTQCRLTKDNIEQVAWIPSEFAKEGEIIKIKKDGVWEDGWKVHAYPDSKSLESNIHTSHNSKDIWKPSTKITGRGNK